MADPCELDRPRLMPPPGGEYGGGGASDQMLYDRLPLARVSIPILSGAPYIFTPGPGCSPTPRVYLLPGGGCCPTQAVQLCAPPKVVGCGCGCK